MDTIAACATPWGSGAIAVVRVSGPDAFAITERVAGPMPAPRVASLRTFADGEGAFDEGLVTAFPGPRSYTGEDLVELSGHGNPLLVERLLRALGARTALPGEFTRRAFLNGRMDLTRAEAVLQSISATSAAGLAVARSAARVAGAGDSLRDALTDLAAELEAILDYPGEDLLFASDHALTERFGALAADARKIASGYAPGRVAVEGARVVLVGPVNAGKSSLFNALLGRARALVSPTPGTTRDVVEATLQLDGVRITLCDTAGERATDDPLERAGIGLGAAARQEADLVVHCVPLHLPGPLPEGFVVGTHADLPRARSAELAVSAVTGEGIDRVRDEIARRLVGEEPGAVRVLLASARQRDCFLAVAQCCEEGAAALAAAGPAVAVERVYAAIEAVAELGGQGVREAVLDRLFARFCVGK